MNDESRVLYGELFVAIDPNTKELLCYKEDKAGHAKESTFCLDNSLLDGKSSVSLHNDREDCYIDICSLEVLSLLADNFDWQDLRRDLLRGLLEDDAMGYKVFTHEVVSSTYAAKVDNFRSYDAISKYLIQTSEFRKFGLGTKIGDNTKIKSSVIGKGCSIGSNVSIEGSYIWENVTIEDGCKLKHAIVYDGAVIKSGTVLEPGVDLSFQVVIGEKCTVSSCTVPSLLPQPIEQDSEDNCDEDFENEVEATFLRAVHDENIKIENVVLVVNSLRAMPDEIIKKMILEANALRSNKQTADCAGAIFCSMSKWESGKATYDLERELDRATNEAIKDVHDENIKNVILDVKALRLSFNKQTADCAGAIFYSMMKLALAEAPHGSASELVQATTKVIKDWKDLLKNYLLDMDVEIEVIQKFEEMCLESAKEISSVFDKILYQLYGQEVIREEAILKWADEKKNAEESDRILVRQVETFIQWLREVEEEED